MVRASQFLLVGVALMLAVALSGISECHAQQEAPSSAGFLCDVLGESWGFVCSKETKCFKTVCSTWGGSCVDVPVACGGSALAAGNQWPRQAIADSRRANTKGQQGSAWNRIGSNANTYQGSAWQWTGSKASVQGSGWRSSSNSAAQTELSDAEAAEIVVKAVLLFVGFYLFMMALPYLLWFVFLYMLVAGALEAMAQS